MKHIKWLLPILVLFVVLFLFPPQAQADGGAPNLAYVAGTAHGISTIDISQQKIVDTLPVNSRPDTILLSIDGRLLFVTQPETNRLTVIAPKTKQTVCTQQIAGSPSLLTLDPGTNILYVAGNGAGTVTGIDPTACHIVRTLHTQSGVYGLAVATVGSGISGGSGNQIWIAGTQGLTIFDGNGNQQATLPMPGKPLYLCIPSGQTVYVVTQQGSVEAVDLASHRLLPPLLTGSHFGPMDYNALTRQIYVPDLDRQRIDVLAPVSIGNTQPTHQPVRTIAFDAAPQSIAITSDGQFGFVALENGTVAMLDLQGKVFLINRLRPLFAIWFFAGMPLNMLLSWLYFFLGGPLPAILFLLSSLVYLSGGLLGTLWSMENLRKQESIRWDRLGALLVLIVSVGFLYLGVLFALKGLQRL